MKKVKLIFCAIILFALILLPDYVNAENYKKIIYHAYVNNQIGEWESVIKDIENKKLVSKENKLELINYYYGFIGYLISSKATKQAKTYISKGMKLIDEILEQTPDNATAYAYKGSFLSFTMAINKIKAFTAAPESMKYINKAYELDPNNIQAATDKGNMMSYAPTFVGGNKKEAVKYYQKAVRLIEEQNQAEGNWFYLNVLVTLAKTYEEINENEKALQVYQIILQKEPEFKWVKDELYPRILSKLVA